MIRKTIITIALLSGVCICTAQTFNQPKMDSLLNTAAANDQAMGSLALMQNGSLVYSKSIGLKAAGTTSDSHTKYRVGSISKMFTAVMILQLKEENKLGLNTPLSTFFPQVPNAAKITISMLLSHRSGLHNFTSDSAYQTYYLKAQTKDGMLRRIASAKPDFEPGSKFAYSNTNYVLLGYIIEQLTGKSYAEALRIRIVSRLGLKETYYGGKINAQGDEAESFNYDNGWKVLPQTDMSIPGGAGAVVSSPADLARFLEGLFTSRLISSDDLAQMKTMQDGYGFALFSVPFYNMKGYGHNGDIDGFSTIAWYFPEQKLAVAYCGNGVRYTINDLMIGVLSIYFNKSYMIPTFKTLKVDEASVKAYLGTYASAALPVKINVFYEGGLFKAQATGQGAFPLEPAGERVYTFKQAGIVLTFSQAGDSLTLQQGGGSYMFKKEAVK